MKAPPRDGWAAAVLTLYGERATGDTETRRGGQRGIRRGSPPAAGLRGAPQREKGKRARGHGEPTREAYTTKSALASIGEHASEAGEKGPGGVSGGDKGHIRSEG